MNIDLLRLKGNVVDSVEIDTDFNVSEETLKETEIIELKNVHVNGSITKDSLDEYLLNLDVKGIMVLPCSITLKPVNVDFSFNICDYLSILIAEIDEKQKNIGNSIDIFPIIWENILMEIPMKVVSEEAKDINLKGDGWKLITEEEKIINPELSKLDDLYKKEVL